MVWISEEEVFNYKLKGYYSVLEANKKNKAGGVLFYYKDYLSCNFSCISSNTMNSIKCDIKLNYIDNNHKKILNLSILGIYRFCTSSIKMFIDEVENLLSNVNHSCIILGDMNIDILDKKLSVEYLSSLYNLGFKENYCEITRRNKSGGTCIDHVFFRSKSNLQLVSKLDLLSFTDHNFIISCLKNSIGDVYCSSKKNFYGNLSENSIVDLNKFSGYFQKYNLQTSNNSDDINYSFNKLIDDIKEVEHNSVVVKKQNNKFKKRAPWASADLMYLSKIKKKNYINYLKKKKKEGL